MEMDLAAAGQVQRPLAGPGAAIRLRPLAMCSARQTLRMTTIDTNPTPATATSDLSLPPSFALRTIYI